MLCPWHVVPMPQDPTASPYVYTCPVDGRRFDRDLNPEHTPPPPVDEQYYRHIPYYKLS